MITPRLTKTELEVLTLKAQGLTSAEAGYVRGTTAKTVKSQLAQASGKLGARNTTHAVAIAMTYGLIQYEEAEDAQL